MGRSSGVDLDPNKPQLLTDGSQPRDGELRPRRQEAVFIVHACHHPVSILLVIILELTTLPSP